MKKLRAVGDMLLIILMIGSIAYAETEENNALTLTDLEISPRIIGGEETTDSWPWMAALVSAFKQNAYDGQFCGGALIHPKWVVTAAHCVMEYGEVTSPEKIDIVLGVHNLKIDLQNGKGERVKVKRIIVHHFYDEMSSDSDIALMELEHEVSYPTIPLVSDDSTLEGVEALAIGWGATEPSGGGYPEVLFEVFMPIVSNRTCNKAMDDDVTPNMLCAGYKEGSKDTCFGDSGGPLMIYDGDTWKLAGLTSWGGDPCAQAGEYGVYIRVSNFTNFIEKILLKDFFACADSNHDGVIDEGDVDKKKKISRQKLNKWIKECRETKETCGDCNHDGVVNDKDLYIKRKTIRKDFSYWFQECWSPEVK